LNWADFAILGIIAVSALISLWRGFFKEALSLTSWVAAIWVALAFADEMARLLADWIDTPSVRQAVAMSVLFVAVLLLGGLINYLIGQLVKKTGLEGTDRVLGSVFGAVRGGLVVAVLVLVGGMTVLPQDEWWQSSQLMPHFEQLALWLTGFLPADIAAKVHF